MKLNTTREERDNWRAVSWKAGDATPTILTKVIDDVHTIEDELARVREELSEQRKWKETAYTERAKLVCLLTRLYPAWLAQHDDLDTTWDDEWRTIVFVKLPTGQASWHMHNSDVYLFDHLAHGGAFWDGHTTEEKYRRVLDVRADMLDRDRIDLARVRSQWEFATDQASMYMTNSEQLAEQVNKLREVLEIRTIELQVARDIVKRCGESDHKMQSELFQAREELESARRELSLLRNYLRASRPIVQWGTGGLTDREIANNIMDDWDERFGGSDHD